MAASRKGEGKPAPRYTSTARLRDRPRHRPMSRLRRCLPRRHGGELGTPADSAYAADKVGVSVVLGKFPTDTPGSCLRIRLTAPAPGLLLRLTTVPDHALAQVSHIRWFFG